MCSLLVCLMASVFGAVFYKGITMPKNQLSDIDKANVKAQRDKNKAADKFGSSVRSFFGIDKDKYIQKPKKKKKN